MNKDNRRPRQGNKVSAKKYKIQRKTKWKIENSKNTKIEIKSSVDRLTSRMEETRNKWMNLKITQ